MFGFSLSGSCSEKWDYGDQVKTADIHSCLVLFSHEALFRVKLFKTSLLIENAYSEVSRFQKFQIHHYSQVFKKYEHETVILSMYLKK